MRFRFDTFLFADYSGASAEKSQRAAIALWRKDRGSPSRKIEGPFTRALLRETVLRVLAAETALGRRVLFGFDHQWSWPEDLWKAARIHRGTWRRRLWELVEGAGARPPLGGPKEFAARFNRFASASIFHAPIAAVARAYSVPRRSTWAGDPVRLTEAAMPGAKPATRLGGPNSVAGQTLHGLGELHLLLRSANTRGLSVLAWPFDALVDDGRSHVGLEIYPTFCRPRSVAKTDDADARACCEWAFQNDLSLFLDLRRASPAVRRAARIEGWILGASPEAIVAGLKGGRPRPRPCFATAAARRRAAPAFRADPACRAQ